MPSIRSPSAFLPVARAATATAFAAARACSRRSGSAPANHSANQRANSAPSCAAAIGLGSIVHAASGCR
jgi:hypothetical protein